MWGAGSLAPALLLPFQPGPGAAIKGLWQDGSGIRPLGSPFA